MAEAGGHRRTGWVRVAGIAAGACFALALWGFGAALDGYSQMAYPVALLGAAGVPRATQFNLLAFLVPGLLAACVAMGRRGELSASSLLSARLGWTLVLLSALAFATQGLLPLDPVEPDAGRGRLHGVAWGLWAIAFVAAALALATAAFLARRPGAAAGHLVAGALVFTLAWLVGDAVPVALAQRAAFACWFAWLACCGWGRSR
ncbi:DUF998 domain-containing protein [Luteimonas sp. A649]